MASYYLDGYTTPYGVDSRQKVKEYQTSLGVAADGIWGPKTQAAYEASLQKDGNNWGASSLMDAYYNQALSMLSAPTIQVNTPSRTEIQADVEASLRPSTEYAIETRRARGETNMAELDADAASRGMGASTYVSSVKGREMAGTERDVALMESNYAATLAERIASYLQYYTNLEYQAQMQNAQLRYNAQSAATSLASQWYQAYLSANAANNAATTVKKSSTGSAAQSTNAYFSMSPAEYTAYVKGMSQADRLQLYSSNSAYWADCREELYGVLGAQAYAALEAQANPSKQSTGKGNNTWVNLPY